MAVNNGYVPGGLVRLQKVAEKLEQDAAAIRRTIAVVSGSMIESSQSRAETTIAGALHAERKRKPQKYSSPEEKERRKGIIRTYLTQFPLESIRGITAEVNRHGTAISKDRVRQILVEMRPEVERVGERLDSRYRLRSQRPPKGKTHAIRAALKKLPKRKRGTGEKKHPSRRPSASFDGTTAEKARTVVQLVRDADGGIVTLKELVTKARDAGITSLTGMVNYTRAGWLRRTRDRKGKTAYRFLTMPPEAAPDSPDAIP